MSDSPVIHVDLGDGKRRRLFLGADELRQIKKEIGRGFYSFYISFDRDAEPDEVAAVLRLAHAHGVPVVPQGGLTGLAGAAVGEFIDWVSELSCGLDHLTQANYAVPA